MICLSILLEFWVRMVIWDSEGFFVGVMVSDLILYLCVENSLVIWDSVFDLFLIRMEMMCCIFLFFFVYSFLVRIILVRFLFVVIIGKMLVFGLMMKFMNIRLFLCLVKVLCNVGLIFLGCLIFILM